ncbi:MAG: glycosyltransferase [Planctomycetes bacterium]|nr:glycosyltransferase [Planctomycetota bacterium]
MGATQLRIWGDPFLRSPRAASMLALLELGTARGWSIGLCLTGAVGEPSAGSDRAVVEITDGARSRSIPTELDGECVRRIEEAVDGAVADTAPLVVFGDPDELLLAALEFPEACVVRQADPGDPEAILETVGSFDATWPRHVTDRVVDAAVLEPFRSLPLATGHETMLFHAAVPGSDLDVLAESLCPTLGLRVQGASAAQRRALGARLGSRVEFVDGDIVPASLSDVLAFVQPTRFELPVELLAIAMSSGRPLIASRSAELARDCVEPGFGLPLGGRPTESGFATDPRTVLRTVALLRSEPTRVRSIARRARERVARRLAGPRPSPPPAELREDRSRPLVVLEAPLFETSSSAHLTIETARALVARDRVDVLLRPRVPFRDGLDPFARRAPELISRLTRRPPRADLWLSAGWPVRASRPDAATFGLRIDYEYGALPTELTPHVTDGADTVVVHSSAVHRLVADAGVPTDRIVTIPHGVDEVFSEAGSRCAAIDAFAAGRRVVLFVGGPIWRKGFDLVVGTMLREFSRDDDVCLLVKTVGRASDYAGYELSDLVERMRRLPTAVEVMVVDDDLEPAELASVYRSADVLLHPYRGEGFCLPVLEARACGLPVVTTAGGSTDDFCEGEGVLRIPSIRRAVGLPDPHEGPPFVLEPDADSIGGLVRRALEPEVRAAAVRSACGVRREFRWERAAERLERMAFGALLGCV